MARYFNVYGVLECEDQELDWIKKYLNSLGGENPFGVNSDRAKWCRRRWCYSDRDVDSINHAFYGGFLKREWLDLLLNDVHNIAKKCPKDEDGFFVDGFFIINDSDDGEKQKWQIREGQVEIRYENPGYLIKKELEFLEEKKNRKIKKNKRKGDDWILIWTPDE